MKTMYYFHNTIIDTFCDLPRIPLSDGGSHPAGAADGSLWHFSWKLPSAWSLFSGKCLWGYTFPPGGGSLAANEWRIPGYKRLFLSSRWENCGTIMLQSSLCDQASTKPTSLLSFCIALSCLPHSLIDFSWEPFFN